MHNANTIFTIPRIFELLRITPFRSFPRKRESSSFWTDVDPCFRGCNDNGDFHFFGWAAALWKFSSAYPAAPARVSAPIGQLRAHRRYSLSRALPRDSSPGYDSTALFGNDLRIALSLQMPAPNRVERNWFEGRRSEVRMRAGGSPPYIRRRTRGREMVTSKQVYEIWRAFVGRAHRKDNV